MEMKKRLRSSVEGPAVLLLQAGKGAQRGQQILELVERRGPRVPHRPRSYAFASPDGETVYQMLPSPWPLASPGAVSFVNV